MSSDENNAEKKLYPPLLKSVGGSFWLARDPNSSVRTKNFFLPEAYGSETFSEKFDEKVRGPRLQIRSQPHPDLLPPSHTRKLYTMWDFSLHIDEVKSPDGVRVHMAWRDEYDYNPSPGGFFRLHLASDKKNPIDVAIVIAGRIVVDGRLLDGPGPYYTTTDREFSIIRSGVPFFKLWQVSLAIQGDTNER